MVVLGERFKHHLKNKTELYWVAEYEKKQPEEALCERDEAGAQLAGWKKKARTP